MWKITVGKQHRQQKAANSVFVLLLLDGGFSQSLLSTAAKRR
jgi:hypothetical protein